MISPATIFPGMVFGLAFRNIWARPVRTSLAVLGMTVAIFAMVSLFSVSAGLNRVVNSTLDRVPGLIAMQRGAPIPLFSTIPSSWKEEIEKMPHVTTVVADCWARVNIINGETIISPPRLLCGTDIARRNQLRTTLYKGDVYEGRFLSEEDVGKPHIVISKSVAEEFKVKVGDPLEVNGLKFTIVGLYHTGSLLLDVALLTDIDVFRALTGFNPGIVSSLYIEHDQGKEKASELAAVIQKRFTDREWGIYKASTILTIAQQVTTTSTENPVQSAMNNLDKMFKGSPPASSQPKASVTQPLGMESPLEVKPAEQWASRIDSFTEDLDLFLFLMTSIGVFIAVVQVINTMLMSVTERVIEFGILRANGWSVGNVVLLVVSESAFLGAVGGVFGSVFGWIAVQVINHNFPDRVQLYAGPELLIYSITFSILMGILGGLYPAYWAATRSPMDAIRRG
ncbi:ABC transporter permease [Lacunimicrobium album]